MAELFQKDGDPAKWVGITETKHDRLEAPRHVRPWTTRPEVRLRGLATELTRLANESWVPVSEGSCIGGLLYRRAPV